MHVSLNIPRRVRRVLMIEMLVGLLWVMMVCVYLLQQQNLIFNIFNAIDVCFPSAREFFFTDNYISPRQDSTLL